MPFVIDVDPVAFALGPFAVRWYGIVLAVAIAAALWVATREAIRMGLPRGIVLDASLWIGLAALAGGRLLFILQNGLPPVDSHPAHLLMVWMGGLSFYGGLIAGMVALAAVARSRRVPWLIALDVAAPAAAIGQAIGHLGCLIGGDSFGLPTSLPWAVIYRSPGALAPRGVPLHPTQAYEAIALAVLFAVLWSTRRRLGSIAPGVVASVYLAGLAVIRFGLFFLRDEPSALLGLRTAQWIGIAILLLAAGLYLYARRHARTRTAHRIAAEVALP